MMEGSLLAKRVRVKHASFNPLLDGQPGTVVADAGRDTDIETFGLVCVLMDKEYLEWAEAEECRLNAAANPHRYVAIEWDSRHAWLEPTDLEVTSC